jgi:hypothetical protein
MNKIKSLIAAAACLLLAGAARAQTNQFLTDIQTSGLLTATNYSFEIYGTYAPKLPKHIGAGVLAIYNVNNYVGVGLGGDELGRFSILSANATLQLPIQPLSFLGTNSTITTILSSTTLTPFQLLGGAVGLSGTSGGNGSPGGIMTEDTGFYIQFAHVFGGRLNTGYAWGQWFNAGNYTGPRQHLFFGWSKGF